MSSKIGRGLPIEARILTHTNTMWTNCCRGLFEKFFKMNFCRYTADVSTCTFRIYKHIGNEMRNKLSILFYQLFKNRLCPRKKKICLRFMCKKWIRDYFPKDILIWYLSFSTAMDLRINKFHIKPG